MDLIGEYTIDAKRQDVWEALNDPEILKVCIPGCEELEKLSDTQGDSEKLVLLVSRDKRDGLSSIILNQFNRPSR